MMGVRVVDRMVQRMNQLLPIGSDELGRGSGELLLSEHDSALEAIERVLESAERHELGFHILLESFGSPLAS
jgi:hypothetical protein